MFCGCFFFFWKIKLYCKCTWVMQFKETPPQNPQNEELFSIICPLLSICVNSNFHRVNLSKLPLQGPISYHPRLSWILCGPTENLEEANSGSSTSTTSIQWCSENLRNMVTVEHRTDSEPSQKGVSPFTLPLQMGWAEWSVSDTLKQGFVTGKN